MGAGGKHRGGRNPLESALSTHDGYAGSPGPNRALNMGGAPVIRLGVGDRLMLRSYFVKESATLLVRSTKYAKPVRSFTWRFLIRAVIRDRTVGFVWLAVQIRVADDDLQREMVFCGTNTSTWSRTSYSQLHLG
jgi:hypothetical protein